MREVEQYRVFELEVQSEESVTFTKGGESYVVPSFADGDRYLVRFAPPTAGEWQYTAKSGMGSFVCTPAREGNHGAVRTDGYHFRYEDGTPYLPFGTTIYAWVHQTEELIAETVESLKNAPFNKVRMCVFPKSMAYNENDPDVYPFEKEEGKWNVYKPVAAFWRKLDWAIQTLDELNIEVDLILFHPYDRWGFAELSKEENAVYLDYCIRRLSAYKNIWWSLANEYELCLKKDFSDWDSYGETLKEKDIYAHLISIHDFCAPYPKRDWMSHASIQSAVTERALLWRSQYRLPVVIDECGYEGNLEFGWGNLSAFEFVHRMWKGIINGGYITHGETFLHENDVIWWAKGGKLQGKALERIVFFRELLGEFSERIDPVIRLECLNPNAEVAGQATPFMRALQWVSPAERDQITVDMIPLFCGNEHCRLYYYGRGCPIGANVSVPSEGTFQAEIIDVWEMTRQVVAKDITGDYKIALPAKEGIAVLLTKIK